MRWIYLLCLLVLPLGLFSQTPVDEEPEIVIELTGDDNPEADGIWIWDKNEKQLNKLFKNKTREEILYTVTTVSSADLLLKSSNGTKYHYVRYGSDDGSYRKLLFDQKDHFLACADNAASVISLNRRYGLSISTSESDFLYSFPDAIVTNLVDFTRDREWQIYQLVLPGKKETSYFLFCDGQLAQTFTDAKDYASYITQLSADNQQWLEEQQELQKKELEQLRQEKEQAIREERRKQRQYKALLEGGTLSDQLYMPRVLHPEKYPSLPLIPSKQPAGTPVILPNIF